MSTAMRAAVVILAGLWAGPAAAQLLGPTWETEIVLSKGDMALLMQALRDDVHGRAVGTVAEWHNPKTGHSGKLRLIEGFFRDGQSCERIDYTISSTTGAATQHWVFDTCRQPDGSWKFA